MAELVESGYSMSARGVTSAELLQTAYKGVSTAAKAVATAAVEATAVVADAAVTAVSAANEQEQAETALATALGYKSQALLDHAAAIQQNTIYGDESVIQAQALIGSFVKEEGAIKAATQAAVDLAAAKGTDLKTAADLVATTLGSSENALSQYGIQVEGAAGSTERLKSITTNVATLFGGQAAAQAQNFGGRVTQLQNAVGNLWEQIGFVITKNKMFNQIVTIITQKIQEWTAYIKENRAWLMSLTQDGLVAVARGIGIAVEVMRFFHNGWLGIKLVGQAALSGIAFGLEQVIKGVRIMLTPFDLIFEALVKLGKMKVNPFDDLQNKVADFRAAAIDSTKDTWSQIEETNHKYDTVKRTVDTVTDSLRAMKAEEVAAPEVNTSRVNPEVETRRLQACSQQQEVLEQEADQQEVIEKDKLAKIGEAQASSDEEEKERTEELAEKKKQLAKDSIGASMKLIEGFSAFTGKQSKTLFKIHKALAIAQVLTTTPTAAMKALDNGGGVPWGIPAFVATIAQGAAQLAAIKKQQFGGSGGVSSGGGAGAGGASMGSVGALQTAGSKWQASYSYERSEYGSGFRPGESQQRYQIVVQGDVYAQDDEAFRGKVLKHVHDDFRDPNSETSSLARRATGAN